MAVMGLNTGERVALLLFLTRDSGVLRNFNDNSKGTAVVRAKAEVVRLRGNKPADDVTGLDQLFDQHTNQVLTATDLSAALGLSADFYTPGGPCPPVGRGDGAIYQVLKQYL